MWVGDSHQNTWITLSSLCEQCKLRNYIFCHRNECVESPGAPPKNFTDGGGGRGRGPRDFFGAWNFGQKGFFGVYERRRYFSWVVKNTGNFFVVRPHQSILLFLGIGGPFFREIKKKKRLPTRERKSADIHLYLSVGWRDDKLKTESYI